MPSASRLVTLSVIGVSGTEKLKGQQGVGKSLLCNRFLRGDCDDFHPEHSSILSQTDFSGSAVINNEHWLFWGEREVPLDEGPVNIRVIEQTVFLDDVEFEPLAGPSTSEAYPRRATATKLESRDKLMYIQKEQLGQEAEFPQRVLPDGKTVVDAFLYVFDVSRVNGRDWHKHLAQAQQILVQAVKTKKPVIVTASKSDASSEDGKTALLSTLQSTTLRSYHFPLIETSAMKRVNVDELFILAAQIVLKYKHRLKPSPFPEAMKTANLLAMEARESYLSVLKGCVPVEEWPSRRPSWERLLVEFSINRNQLYQRFVAIYGISEARRLYGKHVEQAREHWMKARLRALLPQLPRVFGNMLTRKELLSSTWSEANEMIHHHPLFDNFFQPLGELSKQLEPVSTPLENGYGMLARPSTDPRLPAEILLRNEARTTYEEYQQHVEHEQRLEKAEDDFEDLLANNGQICAGRALAEVTMYLNGAPAYEALSPSRAEAVYGRFQNELIRSAEAEFTECLLENIELFGELIRRSRADSQQIRGPVFTPTESELALVRTVLQEDPRYRQLSRLWELRDSLVASFCAFLAHPQPSHCFSRSRCLDTVGHDGLLTKFMGFEPNTIPVVTLNVRGAPQHVAQFVTDVACLLKGDPYQSAVGLARIHCYSTSHGDTPQNFPIHVQLIDSSIREEDLDPAPDPYPPILVAVADPHADGDLLQLHERGQTLANLLMTTFAPIDHSDDADMGWTPDCTTLFGRRQLQRVLEAACSLSLEGNRADMRIRMSSLCGDVSLEPLLTVLNSPPLIAVLPHPNPLKASVVPMMVELEERRVKVDLRVGSVHGWLAARHAYATHGHALVYSTRRRASWACVRAAICRLLSDEEESVEIRPILLIAVQDGSTESELEQELEAEGREVAASVGALFVATRKGDNLRESLLSAWLCFVERIVGLGIEKNLRSMDSRADSDGYATLNEARNEARRPSTSAQNHQHHHQHHQPGPAEFREETSDAFRRRTIDTHEAQLQQRPPTRGSGSSMVCSSSSGSAESSLYQRSRPNQLPAYEGPSSSSNFQAPSTAPTQRRTFGFGLVSRADGPVRRRAPPAPRLLFPGPIDAAPLATPELIDIAPEYSTVQDADEHIYETLEEVNADRHHKEKKSYKAHKRSSSRGHPQLSSPQSSLHSEPSTRNLRQAPLSPNQPSSTGGVFMRSPVVRVRSTAPCLSPPPSSSGVSSTATSPSSTASFRPRSGLFSSGSRKEKKEKPVESQDSKQPKTDKRSSLFFGARSVTMDVLAGSAIREALSKTKKQVPLKESISVESLAREEAKRKKKRKGDVDGKENGGGGLVRKVASSFRLGRKGTTSLAPSPAPSPQPERRQVLKASCEKVVTAFTWLPSRSPKRNGRAASAEISTISAGRQLGDECARGGGLPHFLARCVNFIEKEGGLQTEGIYRIPGNQSQLAEVERQFASNSAPDLSSIELPLHVVATALKNFFSQLSEPVIPTIFHDSIAEAVAEDPAVTIDGLSQVIATLPTPNVSTLAFLLGHLRKVASAPATAMDFANLSKVWWPTLFRPEFTSFAAMSTGTKRLQTAAEALMRHSAVLFPQK